MKRFKVGIDSYCLQPLGLSPFELLKWVKTNGGDGVQFSEINLKPGETTDSVFLKDLALFARENSLYIEWGGGEHIPFDLATGKKKDLLASNRQAAEQARILGVTSIRSCSGGLMRWNKDSPSTDEFLRAMAESLKPQKKMLMDCGVVLAIETHFEFTTFELRRLFDMCGAAPGEYLGICLDTMNLLTMLEDPLEATRRILPWVTTTHIKDGAIVLEETGLRSFPVEAGKGLIDFRGILRLLRSLPHDVNLSLEDHGGDTLIPVFDPEFLARFTDLTTRELCLLLGAAVRAKKLMDDGRISILDRKLWPLHCEERGKRGLRALKAAAEEETMAPSP